MRPSAFVTLGAFFSVGKLAQLRCIQIVITPLILDRVKVITTLVIVWC